MSTEKNKKNNKRVAVIIVIAAVLIICIALAAVMLGKGGDKTPETTAAASETQTTQSVSTTAAETTTEKVSVGQITEEKLNGNTYVLLGKTVGMEGDCFMISFSDGKAELKQQIMGEESTYSADYSVKNDGVHVAFDTANIKSDSFVFEYTGKSQFINYSESAEGVGTDNDLAVIKSDYDNESKTDIVSEINGKTFDLSYFKGALEMSDSVKVTFNTDAEYADDIMLASIDGYNEEYNINCKGINDSLLYCDMYVYNSHDGEPNRYKFCIEKTADGYQMIITDGNGTQFENITVE